MQVGQSKNASTNRDSARAFQLPNTLPTHKDLHIFFAVHIEKWVLERGLLFSRRGVSSTLLSIQDYSVQDIAKEVKLS